MPEAPIETPAMVRDRSLPHLPCAGVGLILLGAKPDLRHLGSRPSLMEPTKA